MGHSIVVVCHSKVCVCFDIHLLLWVIQKFDVLGVCWLSIGEIGKCICVHVCVDWV